MTDKKLHLRDRDFLTVMGILFLVVAVLGFWTSFLSPLASGGGDYRLAVYVHAVVMFGWLILFVVQTRLPGAGHFQVHRSLGQASIPLFAGIWLSAVTISIQSFTGDYPPPIRDLISNLFFLQIVAFFLAPWLYWRAMANRRTSPVDHKRYMLMLTFFLIEAAASRIRWLPGMSFENEYWYVYQYLYLDLFLIALVVWDFRSLGRLAGATRNCLVVFGVYQITAVLIWDSVIWLGTANLLLAIMTGMH